MKTARMKLAMVIGLSGCGVSTRRGLAKSRADLRAGGGAVVYLRAVGRFGVWVGLSSSLSNAEQQVSAGEGRRGASQRFAISGTGALSQPDRPRATAPTFSCWGEQA